MDMDGVKDEEYSGPDPGQTEETTPGVEKSVRKGARRRAQMGAT
jgi:hypothetical protein